MGEKNNPNISIIVPIYNMEHFLHKCIKSVLAQTFKDFELILIDDGSTDSSIEICKAYSDKDSRIIVLHKENGGQGSARNLGLDNCRGEYICFVDSDDIIDKNYLELLFNNAKKYDADISCARMYYNMDKSDALREVEINVFDNKTAISQFVMNKNGLDQAPVAKLYRKKMFDNVRFLELRGYEDTGTIFKAFINAKKIVTQNYSIYYYFQRDNSTMHRQFSEKDYDRVIAYKEMESGLTKYDEYKEASYIVTANKIGAIYYVMGETLKRNITNKTELIKLCQKESYDTLHSKQKINLKNKILLRIIYYFPYIFGLIYRKVH